MFTLQRTGKGRTALRLLAPEGLTTEDFDQLAIALGVIARRARKVGFVAARRAAAHESVLTEWNGTETTNTAEHGDYIVANLSPERAILRDAAGKPNVYVILAAKFPDLYERDIGRTEFGDVFRAKGVVEALHLPGGFEILAPWGQLQVAGDGYVLRKGAEVYGNNRETFEATYRVGG